MSSRRTISVIIPTLNESMRLPLLLSDLAALPPLREVVIADGGSTDGTCAIASSLGCRVVESASGRGTQLRRGVAASTGDWLLVLHADVRLSATALAEASEMVRAGDRNRFGAWPLTIAAPGAWLRVIERGAAIRWWLSGLAYGDQGLLVHRHLYDRAGGYPEQAIMEDVVLMRALNRLGQPVRFGASIHADARRYLREGEVRRALTNVALITLFLLGVRPERLEAWYRPEATSA